MSDYIQSLIRHWADPEMSAVNLKVSHLEKRLFRTYEPNRFVEGEFWSRCEKWLQSAASDAHRKTLLRLLTRIFYVGPAEFEELFRCAYDDQIVRWLADTAAIDVCTTGAQEKLQEAAAATWFCPVSDSFRINSFFHLNNLPPNADLRPDWRSLHELSDPAKLKEFISQKKIVRLVLLEDFVGGGSQSLEAVRFAASQFSMQVLFVPMIVCPDGADAMRTLERDINMTHPGRLKFDPVLELPRSAFITEALTPFPAIETRELRETIDMSYAAVSGGVPAGQKPYHKYGFPPNRPTGGLVVMYTNTPDNTLPLIHWRPAGGTWQPVFPRHSRL